MEICLKMDMSQYFSGINSANNNNLEDPNLASLLCQQAEPVEGFSVDGTAAQLQLPVQKYEYKSPGNQWDSDIECKQEMDTLFNYSDNNNSFNYSNNNLDNTDTSKCEDFQRSYDDYSVAQFTSSNSDNSNPDSANRPYQVSSFGYGTPLPTWYKPPPAVAYSPDPQQYLQPNPFATFPNYQQAPPPPQSQYPNQSYFGPSTTAKPTSRNSTIPPEHMMNMIHLTNR